MKNDEYQLWRIMEWTVRVDEWRRSGLSAYKWCRLEKVAYIPFLYWRKRLQGGYESKNTETSQTSKSFIELPEETAEEVAVDGFSGVIIEYQGIEMKLNREFDGDTLLACLKIFKEHNDTAVW